MYFRGKACSKNNSLLERVDSRVQHIWRLRVMASWFSPAPYISLGCCHVAWSNGKSCEILLRIFQSLGWLGISQGQRTRALKCGFMPWANGHCDGKCKFFRVETFISRCQWIIRSAPASCKLTWRLLVLLLLFLLKIKYSKKTIYSGIELIRFWWFLVVSACLASLPKFLKGKLDFIFNIEATNRINSITPRNLVILACFDIKFMIAYSKFHNCFSIRISFNIIKINRWCIAVFKNIIKFKLLWIAKGMFRVGNIFLLHVIYKMQDLCII